MEASMKVSLKMMNSADKDIIAILMGNHTEEVGKMAKWKATEYYNGKMAKSTRGTLTTISRRAKGHLHGVMDQDTLGSGKEGNSMVTVLRLIKMEFQGGDNGRKVLTFNGLRIKKSKTNALNYPKMKFNQA